MNKQREPHHTEAPLETAVAARPDENGGLATKAAEVPWAPQSPQVVLVWRFVLGLWILATYLLEQDREKQCVFCAFLC